MYKKYPKYLCIYFTLYIKYVPLGDSKLFLANIPKNT